MKIFILLLLLLLFISYIFFINSKFFNNNSIELVVSRYNEHLEWLKNEHFQKYSVIIYNKGNNNNFYKPTNLKKIITLKNVGCCNHTYLYHIIQNYDNLADVTIFLPGSCMDVHKKEKTLQTINRTIKTNNSVFLVSYFKDYVNKSLYSFKLDNYELANKKNRKMNTSNQLKACRIRPFGKWYKTLFPYVNINHVNYQSIFSISRKHILNRSKESYQEILNYVNTDKNEESAHYIERSFLAIFYPIPEKCMYLFKTQKNDGNFV